MKNRCFRWAAWLATGLLGLATLGFLAGCEDEENFDHVPPSGQGAVAVDNQTSDDLLVYFNGTNVGRVADYETSYFDHDPGVVRVVLEGEDSDRYYTGDVDVLGDRLSVLRVLWGSGYDGGYNVLLSFE